MVLAFSNESGFITEVYLWLMFLNSKLKVYNEADTTIGVSKIDIKQDSAELLLNNNAVKLQEHARFIRQFNWQFNYANSIDVPMIKNHLWNEMQSLNLYIDYFLGNTAGLGTIYRQNSNKLVTLKVAETMGLAIPTTIITTKKSELLAFKQQYGNIITKAIQDSINGAYDDDIYFNYTETLSQEFIAGLPDSFFPSLFQQQIEKEFEIRAFFIDSNWYAMAIFSQNDQQTKVDFRQYNAARPNRYVPFKLPDSITNKLSNAMKYLNFATGSVDMIYSKDGEYVFLEVNPVGQFGMTSLPCNYLIEKIIAEKITADERAYN